MLGVVCQLHSPSSLVAYHFAKHLCLSTDPACRAVWRAPACLRCCAAPTPTCTAWAAPPVRARSQPSLLVLCWNRSL